MSGVDPVTTALDAVAKTAALADHLLTLNNSDDMVKAAHAAIVQDLKDRINKALAENNLEEAQRLCAE